MARASGGDRVLEHDSQEPTALLALQDLRKPVLLVAAALLVCCGDSDAPHSDATGDVRAIGSGQPFPRRVEMLIQRLGPNPGAASILTAQVDHTNKVACGWVDTNAEEGVVPYVVRGNPATADGGLIGLFMPNHTGPPTDGQRRRWIETRKLIEARCAAAGLPLEDPPEAAN